MERIKKRELLNSFNLILIVLVIFILLIIASFYINPTGNAISKITDENYSFKGIKGIGIHDNHYDDISGIKELGVQMIRYDIIWDKVETIKGVYDFSGDDQRTNQLIAQGIEPLYLIYYSNCLYNKMPLHQDYYCDLYVPRNTTQFEIFKKAYGNYTYEVVKHYKGKVKYFELWNEPDIFWQPQINDEVQAIQYIELMKEGYARAKEANPDAVILSAGIDTWNMNIINLYIENYYKQGAKDYFDILAIHPYCFYDQTYPLEDQGKTCDAIENIAYIKEIMDSYNDSNKKMWITEWGYPTGGCYSWDGYCEPTLSEENQKIRMMNIFPTLKENYSYVTGFFWYDYKDDCATGNPLDIECRFGLVRSDLSRKPAYYAYQALSSSVPVIIPENELPENEKEANISINDSDNPANYSVALNASNSTNTTDVTNVSASDNSTNTPATGRSVSSSSGGGGGSSSSSRSTSSYPSSSANASSDLSGRTSADASSNAYSKSGFSSTGNSVMDVIDSGCNISETHYPSGYVKTRQYCDKSSGEFINQKEVNQTCEDSFECLSNNCISNKCTSESFIGRIIRKIKEFFGI